MYTPLPDHNYPPRPNSATPSQPKHLTKRSVSEISPPTLKIHRAHHHHSHRHVHRSKHDDPQTVQSAHSNLQLSSTEGRDGSHGRLQSGEGRETRSEGVTPAGSHDVSRRTSLFGGLDALDGNGFPVVREGEVKEERERGVLRATELRNALTNLNTLSNNTTRRLDNTYYSVLEKLSNLQSTIISLKELSAMASTLNSDFRAECEEMVQDVTTQLSSFTSFDSQESRIQDLQSRVGKGRERIKKLGERVDVMRDRVEGWERAEGKWQDKTRRRLRIMWIIMSTVAGVLLFIVVVRYTPSRTQGPAVLKGLNESELVGRVPEGVQGLANNGWDLKREVLGGLKALQERDEGALGEEPRLRVFDEL